MLPAEDIQARTELVVYNPGLADEIGEESVDERLIELEKDPRAPSMEYLRHHFILGVLSHECIHFLMQDGNGRSGPHIAGEVSRMLRLAGSISAREEIPGTEEFQKICAGSAAENAQWRPKGCASDFPTIDGKESRGGVIMLENGKLLNRKGTIHDVWNLVFQSSILPAQADFYLRLLQPPFELSSGQIVAGEDPPFYILRTQSSAEKTIDPRVLSMV